MLPMSALVGCSYDRMDAYYEHASAARADGAMTRGFVPGWLPGEAIDIYERHDLDTNDSILRFKLLTGTNPQPPPECMPIPPQMTSPARLGASWWPSWNSIRSNFELYACGDMRYPGTLGIHTSEPVWIYWSDETP